MIMYALIGVAVGALLTYYYCTSSGKCVTGTGTKARRY